MALGLSGSDWSDLPGVIHVSVTGGTAPYTVSVDGQTFSTSGGVDVGGLDGGSYSVSVADSVGGVVTLPSVTVQTVGGTVIPSSDSTVASFASGVVQDMGTVMPVAVALLSVILAVRVIAVVIHTFWARG